MSEFRLVQNAERSPTMCAACGGNKGPFIDLDVTTFSIATASGWTPIVDGTLYLCVGSAENPGCVVQAARKSGLTADVVQLEELAVQLDAAKEEIEKLRAIAKKKTLSLADAEHLLAPAGDF